MIDILGPDNVGERAKLDLGVGRTIQAPGTTQALRRSGSVTVEFDGSSATILRPDLVGALTSNPALRHIEQVCVQRLVCRRGCRPPELRRQHGRLSGGTGFP